MTFSIETGRAAASAARARQAREILVRDQYAIRLAQLRPAERLVSCEQGYVASRLRADMRTVDTGDVLREWEFKLYAGHRALGQIVTYLALARSELKLRPVRGVIAAFEFSSELVLANEMMNLNLELVTIPEWMRPVGGLPSRTPPVPIVSIPTLPIYKTIE